MGFTQEDMLAALVESGRNNWTLRQMTNLRSEGLLPALKRQTQPGTNKPFYVWDETDIDQIVEVYDLLEYYDGSHETVSLVLWLEGYSFSLDLLRQTFLRPVEEYLQQLTQGETDPDEISLAVSSIALMFINKLRFTPSLADQRKKVSIEQMRLFTQILLDILSNQEPDEQMLRSLCLDDEEILTKAQRMVEVVRDILALPRLREAINNATTEQWQQVRKDYLSFCHVFSVFEERRTNNEGSPFPEEFIMRLKIMGAVWLTAPLLSARYRGYGQWIDLAFEKIHELLADTDFWTEMHNKKKARRASEADVEDREKPELSISE